MSNALVSVVATYGMYLYQSAHVWPKWYIGICAIPCGSSLLRIYGNFLKPNGPLENATTYIGTQSIQQFVRILLAYYEVAYLYILKKCVADNSFVAP